MIEPLKDATSRLNAMRQDGVVLLDSKGGTADDNAYLVTTDPGVAKKYDMHEESEFWGEGDEGEEVGTSPTTRPSPENELSPTPLTFLSEQSRGRF